MPTVQQLEQRLGRLTKKLAAARHGGGDDHATLRLSHKQQRRLQRKLRRLKPAPPAVQQAKAPAPPPATPPEKPQG